MEKEKHKYLLDKNNHLIITQNGQDKYIQLETAEGIFMIPVSMPRRNPMLNFDLENPNDDFWNYISECEKMLTHNSINNWILEEKSKNSNPSSVTDKLLSHLLDELNVCYGCFSKEFINPNPQKNIQYLRDRGYIICTHKQHCSQCGSKQTTYSLTPILKCLKQSYESIPDNLKKKICEVYDYRDSYTGIRNTQISAHIPDHKFPEDRWDKNTPIENNPDLSKEDIKKKFQLLNPQTNMQKQRFCSKCVQTKKRGYPFGIKFYYFGDENWDNSIPEKGKEAEAGCVGCGWYDIEKWRSSLNEKLNEKGKKL